LAFRASRSVSIRCPMLIPFLQYPLARGKVRYVGDPLENVLRRLPAASRARSLIARHPPGGWKR